ncbi:hypothetical protein MO973_36845 [Paenibacillus sp. TRM 82003]|uniref:hypothetical protein n=1 Tax=Kineococcus sp. TRM81007 TaxID=2925831 RepID=UPI001F59C1BD|nr:hypothetical protein [Kineococcus sp. TRM81007]MCI2239915.1 hypothetical protein [Kineococcus sp. TRM81007]MCI3925781.1 hypothetical protein [Paenibacillus sp. TRM 82003]
MNDIQAKKVGTSRGPKAQWVTVRDAKGRPHLEMRWNVSSATSRPAPLHRAA